MFAGYDHSTLYINNINRGPPGDKNTILDYDDLSETEGHTWILPCPNTQLIGKCYFNCVYFTGLGLMPVLIVMCQLLFCVLLIGRWL